MGEGPWGSPTDGTYWIYKPDSPITWMSFCPGFEKVIHSIKIFGDKEVIVGDEQYSYPQAFNINSPSEYLVGIKGGYNVVTADGGTFTAIQWLSFETNLRVYGPFGSQDDAGYTPFEYKAPQGGSIIGFEGRVGKFLNQIGVLVTPQPTFIKVKQWGGPGGTSWEFETKSPIREIIICHGEVIDSLTFKCEDGIVSEKFGGSGGKQTTIDIPKGLHLEGISGTFGTKRGFTVVTSLAFHTDDGKRFGPYGTPFGTNFSFFSDGSIVGFQGHSGSLLDAIGVYVKP